MEHEPTPQEIALIKEHYANQRSKTEVKAKTTNIANPYYKARIQLLNGMTQWRRDEILAFEKSGDRDNRHYMDFVKEVASLGDTFS